MLPFSHITLLHCCDLVSKRRSLKLIGRRELRSVLTSLDDHGGHEWMSHAVNVSLQSWYNQSNCPDITYDKPLN